jgi:hypothetical protein
LNIKLIGPYFDGAFQRTIFLPYQSSSFIGIGLSAVGKGGNIPSNNRPMITSYALGTLGPAANSPVQAECRVCHHP